MNAVKKPPFAINLEPVPPETLGAPNLLQSGFWAALKGAFGWDARAFVVHCSGDDGHDMDVPLLVLIRGLGAGRSLAYVPHGPEPGGPLPGKPCDCLGLLSKKLEAHLPRGCLFVRFDPPWGTWGEEAEAEAICRPFLKAPMDIQVPDTVIVDLSLGEEEILAAMKPKTRYNVRLAEKKGVRVFEGSVEDLGRWYELYRETGVRDGISIHDYGYYEKLFELASSYPGERPKLRLLLAEAEGRLLAGIVTAVFGRRAVYLYGASSNELRNYMASYLLQWRGMLAAKADGALAYDFFGVPPRNDPDHAMYGLYRFKTGFGGRILHRPGSYDFPLSFFGYRAYRTAEALRRWYFKSFRKRDVVKKLGSGKE